MVDDDFYDYLSINLCINKRDGDPIMVDYPGQLLSDGDNLTHHCSDRLMEE